MKMSKIIKAKVKGTFIGVAVLRLNDKGEIIDVEDVQEIEDVDDVEIIYQIG